MHFQHGSIATCLQLLTLAPLVASAPGLDNFHFPRQASSSAAPAVPLGTTPSSASGGSAASATPPPSSTSAFGNNLSAGETATIPVTSVLDNEQGSPTSTFTFPMLTTVTGGMTAPTGASGTGGPSAYASSSDVHHNQDPIVSQVGNSTLLLQDWYDAVNCRAANVLGTVLSTAVSPVGNASAPNANDLMADIDHPWAQSLTGGGFIDVSDQRNWTAVVPAADGMYTMAVLAKSIGAQSSWTYGVPTKMVANAFQVLYTAFNVECGGAVTAVSEFDVNVGGKFYIGFMLNKVLPSS